MSNQKANKTSVPGQALGYSIQFTKMTALLATEPAGSLVSFEVLDDLAVEQADGIQKLVQSKSALVTNPIADRSVAFWKTLANWADALAAGSVSESHLKLVIYVTHERSGGISSKFAEAKTTTAAKTELNAAKTELWGASPNFPLKSKVADELKPQLERFFGATEDIQLAVVRLLEIEVGSGSPQQDLRSVFPFVPTERLDEAVQHACGWVQDKVNTLIGQQRAAIIARDEFHAEMTAYIRKHRERTILQSFAPSEVSQEKAVELMPKVFVQQIQLIGLDFEAQMEAISDYFRASIDRTYWGETAQVHESSFKELDSSLKRTWGNLRLNTSASHKDKPEESQGQILYASCMETKALVENLTPPTHFVPGCLHMLADEKTVGWHPKFSEKLATPQVTEGAKG